MLINKAMSAKVKARSTKVKDSTLKAKAPELRDSHRNSKVTCPPIMISYYTSVGMKPKRENCHKASSKLTDRHTRMLGHCLW